ncbi:retrotransposon protein, putative, ty1-copia subclass [Tanacetum coccineum]|uniref:Retrotransposon protein, putative, ty1-copia subclass n=1 Tax=Tanacetum coccineum TaxID=301880 RepID=A0ABQ4Y5U8_9ASTR
MYVIEQPILPAPAANSAVNMLAEWNAVYDAFNEGACLMLRMHMLGHWKRLSCSTLAELLKKMIASWHCSVLQEAEEPSLGDLNEPIAIKLKLRDPEAFFFYNKWLDAMNAEIQSMIDNMVWVLVDLPPNCKTVGSKWNFKKNADKDGIVHTYKARLVTKGYTQLYGVYYEETFSPVADIRAIRILISITAFYDYEIWQMDVKTAFLNSYLDEDIYMVQPKGFVDPKHPIKVCKLQRSIYGLKQASRSWKKRFDEEIKKFGFAQNLNEPCVYQKASGSNVTFLILDVDDIIIMGNHIPSLQSVKDYLRKWFAMKDLREAAFILGVKIYKDRWVLVTPGSVVVTPGSVITTGSILVTPGSVITTGSILVPPGSVIITGSILVPPGSVITTGSILVVFHCLKKEKEATTALEKGRDPLTEELGFA